MIGSAGDTGSNRGVGGSWASSRLAQGTGLVQNRLCYSKSRRTFSSEKLRTAKATRLGQVSNLTADEIDERRARHGCRCGHSWLWTWAPT